MPIKYRIEASFEKDLNAVKDRIALSKLYSFIQGLDEIDNITQLSNLKKLKSYNTYYRLRLGNYRIGIEMENDVLIFVRFKHRKDIYKVFP